MHSFLGYASLFIAFSWTPSPTLKVGFFSELQKY